MLYTLFRNFPKILQSFTIRIGLHIDIQIFIWHSKFRTDIQSFLQVTMIYITTQDNFLKIGKIRKIMTYLSIL